MREKKEDRRIRRTKRLLRQALAELMNEKEFKSITVKEIAERADLNRGTFYFHYTDTYDLKDKVEDELVETFAQHLDAYEPTEDNHSVHGIADAILSCIEEDKFIVKTLFHDDSGESLRTKFMYVLEHTISRIQTTYVQNETEQEQRYICRFLANGAIGVVSMWLEDDNQMTRKQLTNILDDLIGRVFPVTE
ncbi:MAG: TetR/AcrR family transcriptional regulator [Butyricicoccus sp.]